jgi:hypothetical protein
LLTQVQREALFLSTRSARKNTTYSLSLGM